jgi:hypothetical protein
MMRRCLDEGLLQAYLDGELSQELMSEAAAHVAACAACAAALEEAEGEASFFAAAFSPDDSLSVPTAALRSRIGAAVAQLEADAETNRARTPGRNFGGFLASLSGLFAFTPQTAAAFASLLAVVALAILFFMAQRSQTPNEGQGGSQVAASRPAPVPSPEKITTPNKNEQPVATSEKENEGGKRVLANYSPRRSTNRNNVARRSVAPSPSSEQALPGEKEYQTAIASLEKTIKLGGDATLRPSVRVTYERDLALLDSAIKETRRVAAENPKDKDAVDFLMSAYQSKVELLTKVADQAQVAALGR